MRDGESGKKGMDASGAGLKTDAMHPLTDDTEAGATSELAPDAGDSWRDAPDAADATELHPGDSPARQCLTRVLVGGVGYRNLRDHSVGIVITERLREVRWPDDVEVVVDDLSENPISLVQRLDADPPDRRFARAVVVSAIARGGARWPGAITCYRWDGVLPSDNEIRRAMTEAVTGTVSLDNTLIVAGHFEALPPEVVVVEVEPAVHEFGDTLSTPVAVVLDELLERVVRLASDDRAVAKLPRARLGGGIPLRGG